MNKRSKETNNQRLTTPMLAVENITKKFDGAVALSNISMELHGGKVNAILGENGAGKSTLMKILSGVYNDYEGKIFYKNKEVRFRTVRDAEESGIAIIHQELNLIPCLAVWENIFLGKEMVNKWGTLNKQAMRQKTKELLQRLELNVNPDTLISDLKVGQQQVVEIARALLKESEVIIMDEPTSAISDKEVEVLFGVISDLKKQNKTIVYISHKLDELFRIADHYVVMRDGCFIDSGDMSAVTHHALIEKMVGRQIDFARTERDDLIQKKELLRVDHLTLRHPEKRRGNMLNDICFQLNAGEVIGFFGLMGAGRTELMETIFGLHPKAGSGRIYLDKKPVAIKSPADAIKAGIALVPEDRKKDGLVMNLDVRNNLSLTILEEIERFIFLNRKKENGIIGKYSNELKIKASSGDQVVKNLSGGNQQKVVLAKWLATKPKILLLDEPTRGIDIGAKNEIYKLIAKLKNSGMGIIMVSSELPEILSVSDRVLVMCEGSISAEIPIQQATENNILKAAISKNNELWK